MKKLSYTEIRDVAEDGDIVFFHGTWRNLIQALVMVVTGSRLTHAAVVFWLHGEDSKRLMVVEDRWPHRQIVTFSQYDDEYRKFEIVKAPKPWAEVVDAAIERTSNYKYGLIDFCYIGLRDIFSRKFGITLPRAKFESEVCSEAVARLYGLTDDEITPQQLYNELTK